MMSQTSRAVCEEFADSPQQFSQLGPVVVPALFESVFCFQTWLHSHKESGKVCAEKCAAASPFIAPQFENFETNLNICWDSAVDTYSATPKSRPRRCYYYYLFIYFFFWHFSKQAAIDRMCFRVDALWVWSPLLKCIGAMGEHAKSRTQRPGP